MTTFVNDFELRMPSWEQHDSQFLVSLRSSFDQDDLTNGAYSAGTFTCPKHLTADACATLQSISPCSTSIAYMANLYSRINSHLQSGYTTATDNAEPEPIDSLSHMVETTHMKESPGSSTSEKAGTYLNELPDLKLRTASRKPKRRSRKRQPVSEKILQQRELHNSVEKQYRTRLKQRFENLLAILQASQTEEDGSEETCLLGIDRILSRGEVLDAAARRILTLEKVNKQLLAKQEAQICSVEFRHTGLL